MIKISDYEKQNISDNFSSWLQEDYYQILGIQSNSSNEEIRKAFKIKVKESNLGLYLESSFKTRYCELKLKHLIIIRNTLLNDNDREEYNIKRQLIQDCYIGYMSCAYDVFDQDKKLTNNNHNKVIDKDRLKKYVRKNSIQYDLRKSQIADLSDMFEICFATKENIFH